MRRTKKPKNLKTVRVSFWTQRLNEMSKDPNRSWAKDTLEGIKEDIQDNDRITDKQIRAIKNIQNGRNAITNE